MSTAHGGEAATQGSASPAATQLLLGGSFYHHGHEVTDGFVSERVPRGVHDLPHRVRRYVGEPCDQTTDEILHRPHFTVRRGLQTRHPVSHPLLLRDQGRTTTSEAGTVVGGGPLGEAQRIHRGLEERQIWQVGQ